jgi:hypothetical protein
MEPIVPPPVPTAGGDGLAAVPPSPPCLCLKCVNEV